MKIYEKPMAIINKFEVEDIIAASGALATDADIAVVTDAAQADALANGTQGVVFQW